MQILRFKGHSSLVEEEVVEGYSPHLVEECLALALAGVSAAGFSAGMEAAVVVSWPFVSP
jgi:hypothetical protein